MLNNFQNKFNVVLFSMFKLMLRMIAVVSKFVNQLEMCNKASRLANSALYQLILLSFGCELKKVSELFILYKLHGTKHKR